MTARILILEDEVVVAYDLKSTLEDLGYEVAAIASTAEQAVAKAREVRPDLVLADIVIKGEKDGISAAATIRKEHEVPVIYLTAYSDEAVLERAKSTEPYGYIIKPFQERELHSTIEMALFKRRAEQRIAHLNKVLRAIRKVNQLIAQEKDRQRLIAQACECLVETRGYYAAWIALYDQTGVLSITAQAGVESEFDSIKERLCTEEKIECIGRARRTAQPVAIEDPYTTCTGCPLHNQYKGRGGVAVRIEHEKQCLGFLVLSTPRAIVEDDEELDLLLEVAQDMGLALHAITLAEKRTRSAEELHLKEQAFEHAISALSIADVHGVITQVNQAFLEQWGYGSRQEAIGKSVDTFFANDQDAGPVFETLNTSGRWEGEFLARRADGSTFVSRGLATTMKNSRGVSIGYQSANLDITKQRQAEKALWESEERFRALVAGSEEIVYMIAHDGSIVLSEGKGLAKLGLTPGQIVGESVYELYKDHPQILDDIRRALSGETVISDVELLDNHFRSWYTPHRDRNGEVTGLLGLSINTTKERLAKQKREQAEADLKESKLQMELALEGGALGTWDWDLATNEVRYNHRWATMKGYQLEEIEPHLSFFRNLVHPDDLQTTDEHMSSHLRGETESYRSEFRIRSKSGRWLWILDRGKAVKRDGQGRPLRVCGTHLDITDRKQAEFTLRESEERFRAIYEQSPIAIQFYDLNGDLVEVNKQTLDLFGLKEIKDVIGFKLWEDSNLSPAAAVALKNGHPVHVSARFNFDAMKTPIHFPTSRTGTAFLDMHVIPMRRGNDIIGYLTQIIEETERKKAEASLRESEKRFKGLFDNSAFGVIVCRAIRDDEGAIIDFEHLQVNDATEKQTGFEPDKLLGKRASELVPADIVASLVQIYAAVVETGIPDGYEQHFEIYDRTLEVGACHLVGDLFALTFVNISERKRAQQSLQESEERYRDLYDNAPDMYVSVDANTARIKRCNQTLLRALGYTEEDVLGQPVLMLYQPDNREDAKRVFGSFKTSQVVRSAELQLKRKDGATIDASLTVSTVLDAAGQVVEVRSVLRDISAQLRIEKEKAELEAKLLQQQRLEAIGTLASGVAHEINNPINGVTNYAQLIFDDLGEESEAGSYAKEIIIETDRVATIVRNLLAFSRQENCAHSPARISDIVEATLSLVRTIIRHDQITLVVDVSKTLPGLKCRSQQIQQVLMNLLTNARDALNERFPGHDDNKVLSVTASEVQRDDRRWIQLTVEDRGVGIAPEHRDRIFDPFFTTKGRDRGTGLGLSISHGIVMDHHGELRIDSESGRGTAVCVELPVDNGWSLEQ